MHLRFIILCPSCVLLSLLLLLLLLLLPFYFVSSYFTDLVWLHYFALGFARTLHPPLSMKFCNSDLK